MRISPAHGSNMVPLGCLDHSTARESTWLCRMMKASHSHETPIFDGENPWFPDMSCRFSMIFPSTHPLHDRIWTFAGNVERIIASKCINGQRAFHHGVKFGEPGSKLFIVPHHWRRRKVDNKPCPNKDLHWWNTNSACLFRKKKLKRKFTLMIALGTSRKQTSLLCKFHRFSQKLKVMIKTTIAFPKINP